MTISHSELDLVYLRSISVSFAVVFISRPVYVHELMCIVQFCMSNGKYVTVIRHIVFVTNGNVPVMVPSEANVSG